MVVIERRHKHCINGCRVSYLPNCPYAEVRWWCLWVGTFMRESLTELLMPFRTFYISWNERDEQRSLYACIRALILVLWKEKLCAQHFFQWCLPAKLAALLGDVWACWSLLSAQKVGRWTSSLWYSLKYLNGRCPCSVSPRCYIGPIVVVLCMFLFL